MKRGLEIRLCIENEAISGSILACGRAQAISGLAGEFLRRAHLVGATNPTALFPQQAATFALSGLLLRGR